MNAPGTRRGRSVAPWGCGCRELDAEELPPGAGFMADAVQQRDLPEQQGGADHEYSPPLKFVDEAFSHANAPMFDHHTNGAHPEAIHNQGNRDAGQNSTTRFQAAPL